MIHPLSTESQQKRVNMGNIRFILDILQILGEFCWNILVLVAVCRYLSKSQNRP